MGLGDGGHLIEVEVGERLVAGEVGFEAVTGQAPALALGDLVLEQHREQSHRRPALAVGLRADRLPQPPDGGQAQLGEHDRQARRVGVKRRGGVHAASTSAS